MHGTAKGASGHSRLIIFRKHHTVQVHGDCSRGKIDSRPKSQTLTPYTDIAADSAHTNPPPTWDLALVAVFGRNYLCTSTEKHNRKDCRYSRKQPSEDNDFLPRTEACIGARTERTATVRLHTDKARIGSSHEPGQCIYPHTESARQGQDRGPVLRV